MINLLCAILILGGVLISFVMVCVGVAQYIRAYKRMIEYEEEHLRRLQP